MNLILTYFGMCYVEAVVSSGRVEKSPHEQEIKFFAKVKLLGKVYEKIILKTDPYCVTNLKNKNLV